VAEKLTAARPYAEAAFGLARSRGELAPWSGMLRLAAAIAADERVARLAGDPKVTRERLTALFLEIAGDRLTLEARNFIRLLIDNRRLLLLSEIAAIFEQLRDEAEGTIEAEVVSAFPLSAEQSARIAAALKRRLAREVKLASRVDKDIVGGVVIRAGDLVIDGSARGRLERLAAQMVK
jgi:F-type H+-transporting ATPase subunit delta